MQLILASTSKYRKELLNKLGFKFKQIGSDVDEENFKQSSNAPISIAQNLAKAKALSVANNYPDDLVIGSDQVCSLGQQIFSKAENFENAMQVLKQLSGKTHQLHTAVSLISVNHNIDIEFIETVDLKMRNLTEIEITNYLKQDHPYDCAGCYKIESYGISLFEEIICADHSAIIGLPLLKLNQHLLQLNNLARD
jgi:septum formation protein